MHRPPNADIPDYFRRYSEQVPDGDVLERLALQIDETLALFNGLSDDRARHRYAEGKWSVKEVLGHLVDSERIFATRALWFARGDTSPLPGFDQDVHMQAANFDERPIEDLAEEMRLVRAANLATFGGFSEDAWQRTGVADGATFRVTAVPWILAGHELHHRGVLLERYGL